MVAMPTAHVVTINLDLGGKTIHKADNEEIAKGMDIELELFQQWFRSQGNQALLGVERSILKTYLAWKLLYEKAGHDSQT
jgi:hypothetical protein